MFVDVVAVVEDDVVEVVEVDVFAVVEVVDVVERLHPINMNPVKINTSNENSFFMWSSSKWGMLLYYTEFKVKLEEKNKWDS